MTVSNKPPRIFICYAHADNESPGRWLDRLLEHLEPLKLQEQAIIWSDQNLRIGDPWHDEIQTTLKKVRAAVLLVSPAFFKSQYIRNIEVPALLHLAKEQNVTILPIILRHSLLKETTFKYPDPEKGPNKSSLSEFQSANPLSKPLNSMKQYEQDRILMEVAKRLLEICSHDHDLKSNTTVNIQQPSIPSSLDKENLKRETTLIPDLDSRKKHNAQSKKIDSLLKREKDIIISINNLSHVMKPIPPENPSFWMSQHLISNNLYSHFIYENDEFNPKNRDLSHKYLNNWHDGKCPQEKQDLPVTHINFEAATAFAKWLSLKLPKYSISLPTYTQWEMAVVADKFQSYEQMCQQAIAAIMDNCFEEWLTEKDWNKGVNYSGTYSELSSIKALYPNPFGIYDLLGNACDMCVDTSISSSPIILAGGCCHSSAKSLFNVSSSTPEKILSNASFRLVINNPY